MKKAIKEEVKRQRESKQEAKVNKYVDKVQLGVQGYKGRYYAEKFYVFTKEDQAEFSERIRQSYIEGL